MGLPAACAAFFKAGNHITIFSSMPRKTFVIIIDLGSNPRRRLSIRHAYNSHRIHLISKKISVGKFSSIKKFKDPEKPELIKTLASYNAERLNYYRTAP
jgi:hypothetical protein